VIEQRCRYLLDLTRESLGQTLHAWWDAGHLDALRSGVGLDGRALPSSGFMAAARLGWTVEGPSFHRPSRFDRGVLVRAMAIMRARREEAGLMTALLPLIDGAGEYQMSEIRATPEGQWAPHVSIDRLSRSIHRFRRDHGRDPGHLTELFGAPSSQESVFPFSACDRQFVQLEVRPRHLILKVKLPVVPRPLRAKDWQWHRVVFKIPAFRQGDVQEWSSPNLRMTRRGQVLFDFATSHEVPAWKAEAVVVGVDWSPGSLCCAATVRSDGGRFITDGQGYGSGDAGRMSKAIRLQREEELTRAKRRRLEALAEGLEERCMAEPGSDRPVADLDAKVAVLQQQEDHLSRRRGFLNREIAWLAANELVDLAVREGASMIAFEDLRDLDPRGRGVWQNNRSAQSVRGLLCSSTEHLASKHGIEVVQVPARGTSSRCIGCDGEVQRPAGHFSAECPACELGGDRDIWAAVNIAKRALAGRAVGLISRPWGRGKRVKKVLHQAVEVRPRKRRPASPRRKVHPTRTLSLPPRKVKRDASGNVVQQKVLPARASLRAGVERVALGHASSSVQDSSASTASPGSRLRRAPGETCRS